MAAKDYPREGITIHWDPEICMHSAVCVKSLPDVFRPKEQPWIDAAAAEVAELIATIDACPTRALTYSLPDEEPVVQQSAAVTIEAQPDGPLLVEGPVSLVDADGNVVRSGERFFLCRCGHSASKPYCDGSHRKHGFKG